MKNQWKSLCLVTLSVVWTDPFSAGYAYASCVNMGQPQLGQKMVTHSWRNKFSFLPVTTQCSFIDEDDKHLGSNHGCWGCLNRISPIFHIVALLQATIRKSFFSHVTIIRTADWGWETVFTRLHYIRWELTLVCGVKGSHETWSTNCDASESDGWLADVTDIIYVVVCFSLMMIWEIDLQTKNRHRNGCKFSDHQKIENVCDRCLPQF